MGMPLTYSRIGGRRIAIIVGLVFAVLTVVGVLVLKGSSYGPQASILFSDVAPLVEPGPTHAVLGLYPTALPMPNILSPEENASLAVPWSAPLIDYPGSADATNPVAVAISALDAWDRYLQTGDSRFANRFLDASEWLVEEQSEDGSWRYSFRYQDLQPGWVSCMAQGLGISALLRAHQLSDDDMYLRCAESAYTFMNLPASEGGTVGTLEGLPFYEEYPGSAWGEHVLNGSIYALFSVHEYAEFTGSSAASRQASRMSENLASLLGEYDSGWWSSYSLSSAGEKASPSYHHLHVRQLMAMYRLTGDERWKSRSDMWAEYAQVNRWRYLWSEVADRL